MKTITQTKYNKEAKMFIIVGVWSLIGSLVYLWTMRDSDMTMTFNDYYGEVFIYYAVNSVMLIGMGIMLKKKFLKSFIALSFALLLSVIGSLFIFDPQTVDSRSLFVVTIASGMLNLLILGPILIPLFLGSVVKGAYYGFLFKARKVMVTTEKTPVTPIKKNTGTSPV